MQGRGPETRELHREGAPEICRGSPADLQLSPDQHIHVENTTRGWRKNHPKGLEGTTPCVPQIQELFLLSPAMGHCGALDAELT